MLNGNIVNECHSVVSGMDFIVTEFVNHEFNNENQYWIYKSPHKETDGPVEVYAVDAVKKHKPWAWEFLFDFIN